MRMTPALQVLLSFCLLGLSHAAPKARNVRWCVTSDIEEKKCNDLVNSCHVNDILLICVKKSSTEECVTAISNGEADAISLDSADIYKASVAPLNLKPIISESHHSQRDVDLEHQGPCDKKRQSLLKGGRPLLGAFLPRCDEKGNYRPKQCHGSSGYCWCVNEDGKEINGTRTPPGKPAATCEEHRQITPCLKHRQSLLKGKKPKIGTYLPQCDENGAYIPKQCHGSTGYCWCVDKNGDEIQGKRAQQGKANITCEEPAHTPCLKERLKQLGGEMPLPGAFIPQCDEKGNYSPQQCHGSTGYCWCVNEHGQEIAGTKTPRGQPAKKCGVSADTPCLKERLKQLGGEMPLPGAFIPQCDEKGNFNPQQCHGSTGFCWCVNEHGEEIAGTKTPPDQTAKKCGVPAPVTCHYAVAVVKKSSALLFHQLKGKRSCHSAVGSSAGWIAPLYALLKSNLLLWEGPEKKSINKAVSEFFSASCAPGAQEANLCQQCAGQKDKCKRSPGEPYYGDEGAFKCLRDGKGDVAFVEDTALLGQNSDDFELLCPDNTTSPLSQYKDCNFGKVPTNAVATRSSGDKIKDITEYLLEAQKQQCKLFISTHGKNLLFRDKTTSLIPLPPAMDTFLFLGAELFNAMKRLKGARLPSNKEVRWCTRSQNEKSKCDDWSAVSGGSIKCTEPSSEEKCIEKILKGEADAATFSAENTYTALKCGLVPAVDEYHNKGDFTPCRTQGAEYSEFGSTRAVALVKKNNKYITWNNLRGKKSCHPGVDNTAGWTVPVALFSKQTKNCDIGTYFNKSCAPGSDINSTLCKLCIGDPQNPKVNTKCSASDKEAYHGSAGAIRCLVETGDVAFVSHSAIFKNTDGKNTAPWARNLKSTDFELLCPDGTRAPVSDYKKCKLISISTPTVVTREESVSDVVRIMHNQQSLYGREGFQKDIFQMFSSSNGQNLLFSDNTQCLIAFDRIIGRDIMEDYFGKPYNKAIHTENSCFPTTALASACSFHHC